MSSGEDDKDTDQGGMAGERDSDGASGLAGQDCACPVHGGGVTRVLAEPWYIASEASGWEFRLALVPVDRPWWAQGVRHD